MKRKAGEVQDTEEGKVVHPLFALARKGDEATKHAESSVEAVDVDDAQTKSVKGISGVPSDTWDPLLLGLEAPSKSMEQNLNIHTIPAATLNPTTDEQIPETDDLTPGTRTIKGLAVRKSMLRADEKIKTLRDSKGSATSKGAVGKVKGKKGGLDPTDKRWSKVYKAAWKSMGGDDIAPSTFSPSTLRFFGTIAYPFGNAIVHTTPKTHTKIHHILRVFDLSPEYGPCVGISRLARWDRAKAWGLEPPEEVSAQPFTFVFTGIRAKTLFRFYRFVRFWKRRKAQRTSHTAKPSSRERESIARPRRIAAQTFDFTDVFSFRRSSAGYFSLHIAATVS